MQELVREPVPVRVLVVLVVPVVPVVPVLVLEPGPVSVLELEQG